MRARLHDERRARHPRPGHRVHLRLSSRGAPTARSSASTRSTPTSTPWREGPADIAICGVFAPTDHLFFHTGWGCMSADLVVKEGGTIIYCSPSPGRVDRHRRLPGPRAHGPDEAVHAADPRELRARAEGHPRADDPDVGRLHLGADLRGDDAQAAASWSRSRRTSRWPRTSASTRRPRSTTRSLRRMERHGPDGEGRSCSPSPATSSRATRSGCTPRTLRAGGGQAVTAPAQTSVGQAVRASTVAHQGTVLRGQRLHDDRGAPPPLPER